MPPYILEAQLHDGISDASLRVALCRMANCGRWLNRYAKARESILEIAGAGVIFRPVGAASSPAKQTPSKHQATLIAPWRTSACGRAVSDALFQPYCAAVTQVQFTGPEFW
jgi:hypothetical protein